MRLQGSECGEHTDRPTDLWEMDESKRLWQQRMIRQLNGLAERLIDRTVTEFNVTDVKLQIRRSHHGRDAERHRTFLHQQQNHLNSASYPR